jgi:hypothetical protein
MELHMSWHLRNLFFVFGLSMSLPSFAQDDWLDDEEDKKDKRDDSEEDKIDLDEDPDEENIEENNSGDKLDLGDDFDDVEIRGDGEDDADIYRKFREELDRLGPAEEAIEWQEYLMKYPNSIFRSAIEKRLEELEAELYDERIEDRYQTTVDDGQTEIKMTQPVLLHNIDPRQKLRIGFEMGLPSHFNLLLDYEHQLKRELSVHGGIRNGVTGWTFEPGVKYALIKSSRLQMLTTGNFDLILGTNIGFRPMVGWSKRFILPQDVELETMAQVGSEIILSPSIDPRLQGGFQIAVAPNHTIKFFLETMVYMKDLTWDDGDAFAFNSLTFGLKFFDQKPSKDDVFEVGLGASAPYYYKYWRQHYGAVTGDVNLYFDGGSQ